MNRDEMREAVRRVVVGYLRYEYDLDEATARIILIMEGKGRLL